VHLQVQRWFHECSLRRVSVQAAEAAEVEPFGERGRLHDQLGGLRQASGEDRQRGLRRLTGVLDGVGQHDELLLRWFLQLVEQQHQPVVLAFPGRPGRVLKQVGKHLTLHGDRGLRSAVGGVGDDLDDPALTSIDSAPRRSFTFRQNALLARSPRCNGETASPTAVASICTLSETLSTVVQGHRGDHEAPRPGTVTDDPEGDGLPEASNAGETTLVPASPELATRVRTASARTSCVSRPTRTAGLAPNPGLYGLSIKLPVLEVGWLGEIAPPRLPQNRA
jgi:hypothetical protein